MQKKLLQSLIKFDELQTVFPSKKNFKRINRFFKITNTLPSYDLELELRATFLLKFELKTALLFPFCFKTLI